MVKHQQLAESSRELTLPQLCEQKRNGLPVKQKGKSEMFETWLSALTVHFMIHFHGYMLKEQFLTCGHGYHPEQRT